MDAARLVDAVSPPPSVHSGIPRVVTVTQATEFGTVYTPAELRRLTAVKTSHNLLFHMDGSRLANAVATLNVNPKEVTWLAGIDALTFGGSKNGGMLTEAIVFFDSVLAEEFEYRQKQAGQLTSKMRYLSASWIGLLSDSTWLRHAAHANECARRLAATLGTVPGARVLFPVEANMVFVELPEKVALGLRSRGWIAYHYESINAIRFVCSWNTSMEAVEALAADARELSESGRRES